MFQAIAEPSVLTHYQLASAVFKSNAVGGLSDSLIRGHEERLETLYRGGSFRSHDDFPPSPLFDSGEDRDAQRRAADEGFVSVCPESSPVSAQSPLTKFHQIMAYSALHFSIQSLHPERFQHGVNVRASPRSPLYLVTRFRLQSYMSLDYIPSSLSSLLMICSLRDSVKVLACAFV